MPRGVAPKPAAQRGHQARWRARSRRASAGAEVVHEHFFDTLTVRVPGRAAEYADQARGGYGILLRVADVDTIGIAVDETTTVAELHQRRRAGFDVGGGLFGGLIGNRRAHLAFGQV